MVSPNFQNPRRYHFTDKFSVPGVVIARQPLSTDIKDPSTARYYERPHFWQIGKNPSTGTEGDLYYLADITANTANWKLLSVSATPGGNMISLTPDDATAVLSDAGGDIDIQGVVVANAANTKPVWTDGTPASNLVEIEVQVGKARTGAPGDKNDAGLSSFNDTQFTVDSDGYVSAKGGTDLPPTQTLTGDDAVVVGPDASGNIDLTGEAVANATNAKPLYFDGGTNAQNAEIQVATEITGAPADKNDAGIASFDDTAFVVDANGYVTLVGGAGPAVDAINVDSNTGPGTDPVLPNGSGIVQVAGDAVAAHSVPIETHSRAANAYNIEVQVAATNTGTPVSKVKAGLSQFNDTQFTVDTDGYVSAVGGTDLPPTQTLTGDDATVVGPDASGNIDITGEAVANATNAKPVYFDGGTNAQNCEVQVGKARTGAPSDKNDAGLVSFDDTSFAVSTHGYVTLSGGMSGAMSVACVTLTASQVKNLFATPITIVAAGGAGTIQTIHQFAVKLNVGSEVFTQTSADNLNMYYGTRTTPAPSREVLKAVVTSSVDTYGQADIQNTYDWTASGSENKALVISHVGTGEFTGNSSNDGTLTVCVWYSTQTFA